MTPDFPVNLWLGVSHQFGLLEFVVYWVVFGRCATLRPTLLRAAIKNLRGGS